MQLLHYLLHQVSCQWLVEWKIVYLGPYGVTAQLSVCAVTPWTMCDKGSRERFLGREFKTPRTINNTEMTESPYVFLSHLILGGYIQLQNESSVLDHLIKDIGAPLHRRCE